MHGSRRQLLLLLACLAWNPLREVSTTLTISSSEGGPAALLPTARGADVEGAKGPREAAEGDVRLADGVCDTEGRVEIYHNATWGTVCSFFFFTTQAQVACAQLGLTGGQVRPLAYYGQGKGPVWMSSVICSGSESALTNCTFDGWGETTCTHEADVGVACDERPDDNTSNEDDSSSSNVLRLVDGPDNTTGALEVLHNGKWGRICDDFFDDISATVACRQLGFANGYAIPNAPFGQGEGKIWMDNVICSGAELRLDRCVFNGWGKTDCTHWEDVGVKCFAGMPSLSPAPSPSEPPSEPPDMPDGVVRLAGGMSALEGRVEVWYAGAWGTVCSDDWGVEEAKVACRQLGLTGGTPVHRAYFGQGSGLVLMDDMLCEGDELQLSECTFSGWGVSDCEHQEDAGVVCGVADGQVRLAGGSTPHEGRVEVLHNNVWGTVCRDGWSYHDAVVVCHMLDYDSGRALRRHSYGPGSGAIWMDWVACSGHEQRLDECDFLGWGQHDCHHGMDAGVSCYNLTSGDDGGDSDGPLQPSLPPDWHIEPMVPQPNDGDDDGYPHNGHPEYDTSMPSPPATPVHTSPPYTAVHTQAPSYPPSQHNPPPGPGHGPTLGYYVPPLYTPLGMLSPPPYYNALLPSPPHAQPQTLPYPPMYVYVAQGNTHKAPARGKHGATRKGWGLKARRKRGGGHHDQHTSSRKLLG